MTTTALLTELEALNLILTAADEDPVQTIALAGHLPLSLAKGVLNDTSRVVQSMDFAFNTEYEYPLTRDVAGLIPLPSNLLKVDVDDRWSNVDPIQRGLKLYDRKAHTYVFPTDVTAKVTFLLPWDELPHPARYYIAVRAARTFQVRVQAGEVVFKFSELEEQMALLSLQSMEADASDANFLTDSWSCASVLQYRES